MGRMRIKKKEAVIPFRETVAFRMIIAGGWFVIFVAFLYILAGAFRTNITLAIVSGLVSVAAAYGIIYNLDHMREAKVPKKLSRKLR